MKVTAGSLRRWAAYIVLVLFVVILESAPKWRSAPRCDDNEERMSSIESVGYELFSNAGYRRPRARHVRLVTLSLEAEGAAILHNKCDQRGFLADVITSLGSAGASLIVVDKFFGSQTCPAGHPGTKRLVEAVERSPVPVVVGFQTDLVRSKQPPGAPCLSISRNQLFEHSLQGSSPLRLGLTRLDEQTGRIPLEWQVVDTSGVRRSMPTLSLVAATLRDDELNRQASLVTLRAEQKHPFTTFIPRDGIPSASAIEVLCDYARPLTHPIRCDPGRAKTSFAGHIAVVGDVSDPADIHDSPLGRVPGVVLQANYIESLLDDRFFGTLHPFLSSAMLLVGGMLIQLAFGRMPAPKAFLYCLLVLVFVLIVSYVFLLQFRLFLPPWFEALGLLIFLAAKLIEGLAQHVGGARRRSAKTPVKDATRSASEPPLLDVSALPVEEPSRS